MNRVVETLTSKEVSKAEYKGFDFTFYSEFNAGNLHSFTVTGYKSTGEVISGSYNNSNDKLSLTFTPASCTDKEIAEAIELEFEVIKTPQ